MTARVIRAELAAWQWSPVLSTSTGIAVRLRAFQFAIRFDSIRYANRFESIRFVKKIGLSIH